MTETDLIRNELRRAARELGAPESVEPVLERPRDPAHGDWATNFAMVLARPLRKAPKDVAAALVSAINVKDAGVREMEIAGPGFINFRVDVGQMARALVNVIAEGDAWGRSTGKSHGVANVEFVSANPTGPLHVGHGRQAALGDAISTLLEWSGWDVSREFYYNDAGAQIERLAESMAARVVQESGGDAQIPEGGYHGEYIREIARAWLDERKADGDAESAIAAARHAAGVPVAERTPDDMEILSALREYAVRALRREQDLDLQAFGVRFDTYFLESSLYSDGKVEKTIAALGAAGKVYEHEGALWLRTTEFGDDKDRVARKSDGSYTYFLPDVAYHVTKWERGFRRAINVQGADHHSTVTRVRAGLQALNIGIPQGYPEYVLHQMVTVMRAGEEVKISKRAGSYVTVRDLIDEVGRDAVRWFFLMRKGDSQLIFDVDLARAQSEENPVYYVQMAHARMSGIFRVGSIDPETITGEGCDFSVLALPEEQELVKALLDFPAVVGGAAESLEPHRVASYLLETARKTHLWYHKSHVLLEGDDPATMALREARLALARAARVVLRNGLTLLGISAPERM
jgi:arginyl-tRNA synthetase